MAIQSEVQWAPIQAAALGDNTLVAAVADRKIRVLSMMLVASGGANTVRLESGGGGGAMTGQMDLAADGQLLLPYNPSGWNQTAAGATLNLELSAATAVAGVLAYVLVE